MAPIARARGGHQDRKSRPAVGGSLLSARNRVVCWGAAPATPGNHELAVAVLVRAGLAVLVDLTADDEDLADPAAVGRFDRQLQSVDVDHVAW